MAKNYIVSFQATEEQYLLLKKRAEESKTSMSSIIRSSIAGFKDTQRHLVMDGKHTKAQYTGKEVKDLLKNIAY